MAAAIYYRSRLQKKGDPLGMSGSLLWVVERISRTRYLMATAVFGVGTPVGLIAVIGAAVSWNTVCASLVPKYRVPDVSGASGEAAAKYRGAASAAPLQTAVGTTVPSAP
jgi:hypothetical protein